MVLPCEYTAKVQSHEAKIQNSAPGFKSGMYVILDEFTMKYGISMAHDNKQSRHIALDI